MHIYHCNDGKCDMIGDIFYMMMLGDYMKKFKANDNKSEEHEINYRQFNKKLELLNQILSLISDINQASNEKEVKDCIPALLQYTGEYTDADRVYIFELMSEKQDYYSNTFEWCREGIIPQIDNLIRISADSMPVWHEKFLRGETIIIHDLEKIRETMPSEYDILKVQDIHSLLVLPLFANTQLSGFIGLDNPELVNPGVSISLLSNAGGHLASTLNNLRMFRMLEEKQKTLESNLEELQKEKHILEALCVDYTSFYLCDLANDTLEAIKQSIHSNWAEIDEMPELKSSYTSGIRYYYDHYVIRESAPDFLRKMERHALIEYLRNHKRFAYRYQSVKNHAGHEYFELQVIRLETGNRDDYKIIMGFRYIDDIVQEDMKKKQQMEETMADLKINNEIISAISKMYWIIYRMDLIHDTYEEISSKESIHRPTGRNGKISVQFTKAREKFIAPEFQERMREFLDASTLAERLKNREEISTEYRAITGVWHQARFIVKLRNEAGEVTNVLYVTRDINDQKISELESREELRRTAQEAEKANLAKTDFLRRMSHDIRTPINGIQGCVDIADRYPDDLELQQEARTKIRTASGYLLNLVNDVLDMNKLESGNIQLERKHFNLLELLHNTNEITRMQANESGINYYVEDGEIIHTQLIGSPVHFQQILMNIGSNAVKYNHDGGSVTVTCREVSYTDTIAEYELTCTDTGIGMSEEFQKRAFEPFAQEGQSARTKYAGTGLGLAIARKLTELQGGTLFFDSIQGKGTKFILHISFEISAEEQEKKSHMYQNCSVEGIQVLLVEDNELNMEIAEFLLKEEKMIVTKAWNGREAVEIFENSEPGYFDVILMDLMMPQMGGLEATRRIRKLDRRDAKTIPIFAMTANAFLDDIAQSKAAGMNEHFSKPLQMEKVIDTIRSYCTAR